jgi:hypothetical protein
MPYNKSSLNNRQYPKHLLNNDSTTVRKLYMTNIFTASVYSLYEALELKLTSQSEEHILRSVYILGSVAYSVLEFSVR